MKIKERGSILMGNQNLTTDIVVVGSGMAGLAAATEAGETGANVIVLESQEIVGGNSNLTEGVMGVGTPLQEKQGINVDVPYIFHLEQEFQNYNIDPILWETIFTNSSGNIQWLEDHGVNFAFVSSPGNSAKTWHVYDGPEDRLGFEANSKLAKAAEAAGVRLIMNTEGRTLKMSGSRVVGIEAFSKDGTQYSIDAKAVILAGGGMGANMEELGRITNRVPDNLHYYGAPGNNGTCIRMAEQAGGGTPKNIIISMVGSSVEGCHVRSQLSESGAMEGWNIWLNQNGVRFANEGLVDQYSRACNLIQNQQKTFSVYDQNTFEKLMTDGCANGWGMFVLPGTKLTDLPKELEQYKDNPFIYVADTLEDFADHFGINPDAVKNSIAEYNGMVAAGEDTKYHKPAELLRSVSRPPFYCFRIKANNLNTMGGIRIDTSCHVLTEQYVPIPGLYAAGMDCSGFSGETYGLNIPGSCQGIALGTGRIAGANAARESKVNNTI